MRTEAHHSLKIEPWANSWRQVNSLGWSEYTAPREQFTHKVHDSLGTAVDASVINLFDRSVFYAAFLPANTLIQTFQEAGYRGLQWHPIRTVAGIQLNRGLVTQNSKNAIVSLHQSWRSEKSLIEAWRHPNRPLAMMAYVLLPEMVNSLNALENLQKVLGKNLPVVLYPPHPKEESGTQRPFAEKIFQPYTEVMFRWGVRTPEKLIEETYKRGYTGLCIDLFHMRRKNINSFDPNSSIKDSIGLNPWQETLPQLLPHTTEIHISAGRTDIKEKIVDTENELRSLLNGQGNTELIKMLKFIRDSGWRGRIVTEIPAAALRALRGKNSTLSIRDFVQDHRKIISNIQDILG